MLGFKTKYRTMIPPPTSLILVAVIKDPRDLEIARVLGWYRIPLRSAPKVIAVDYLAFYQTGAFGAEGGRIQFVAPVYGHELTTRAELLSDEIDHPYSSQEYYKIQIGPLERLHKPILATEWRRITFIYSTGEYLTKAEVINDLVVRDDERQLLWRALRERALAQDYRVPELPEIDVDPSILASLLGINKFD